jgi:hypothetical protein
LTRASIDLRKNLSKRMDCRVKPGNDETLSARPALRHRLPGAYISERDSHSTGP